MEERREDLVSGAPFLDAIFLCIARARDLSLSLLFFPIVSSLCLSVEDGARGGAMRSRVIGERERVCFFLIDDPFVGESQNRNARDVLFDRRERERLETFETSRARARIYTQNVLL